MRSGYLGVGSFSLVILAGGAVACGSTGDDCRDFEQASHDSGEHFGQPHHAAGEIG
jgi:hypothetical protein